MRCVHCHQVKVASTDKCTHRTPTHTHTHTHTQSEDEKKERRGSIVTIERIVLTETIANTKIEPVKPIMNDANAHFFGIVTACHVLLLGGR